METNVVPPQPESRAAQPVGADRDPAQRPGVPRERKPAAWPYTRYPPEPMRSPPSVFMHGRPGKTLPPVYGTAVPPRGLSGKLRGFAARWPDHAVRYWLLRLLADRVDVYEHGAGRKYTLGLGGLLLGWAGWRGFARRRRRRSWWARWV